LFAELRGYVVRTLTGARLTLSVQSSLEHCYIDADRSQFYTAIVNMAVNARDAMKGEGELTITVTEVSEMPAIRLQDKRREPPDHFQHSQT